MSYVNLYFLKRYIKTFILMTQIFATLPLNFAPMPRSPRLDSGPGTSPCEQRRILGEASCRGAEGVAAAGSPQSPGSPLGPLAPPPAFWPLEAGAGASPEPHTGRESPDTVITHTPQ